MATQPPAEAATSTATKLKLDPPDVLQTVAPADAAGLVPLKAEETSELDKRVGQFVDELAALDSNSPEFGTKVDQLTTMGRKEIAAASARTLPNFAGPSKHSIRRARQSLARSWESSHSATASTAISTNIAVRRPTSKASSTASVTARTSC